MSASFFNACIEMGRRALNEHVYKMYRNNKDSLRQQRIDCLLKVCYAACVKYYSDFKASEKVFTEVMYSLTLEGISCSELLFYLFKEHLPGLPEKIPQQIFKTQLSGIEGIPEKIPEAIEDKKLVSYLLNTLSLIKEQGKDFENIKDDLILEHFIEHDDYFGSDTADGLYFLKKTKENHALPRGSTEPFQMILKEAELADLKLASEMIFKYNQPSRFNFNTVDEIYQAMLDYYSPWQIRYNYKL